MFATESYIVNNAQPLEIKRMEPEEGEQLRNEHVSLKAHMPLDTELEDKENKISTG